MMKKAPILMSVLLIIAVCCGNAAAQVVIQSFEDAMRSDMYEPPYVDSRVFSKKTAKPSDDDDKFLPGHPVENYNKKIAAKLFKWDLSEKPYADITLSRKKQDYKVAPGQTLNIILRSATGSDWLFDKNSKLLEYVGHKSGQAGLMISFRVKNAGKEKLYFDLIQKDGDKIKVIESRILILVAEERS